MTPLKPHSIAYLLRKISGAGTLTDLQRICGGIGTAYTHAPEVIEAKLAREKALKLKGNKI